MKKVTITLTGADEHTDPQKLQHLMGMGAEIGFLYTYSPDGRNRYPRLGWISEMCRFLVGTKALHVCGSRARAELAFGRLDWVLTNFDRIQINGYLDSTIVSLFCRVYSTQTIITQHNDHNVPLLSMLQSNHAVLIDKSGGRGQLPAQWERPVTDKLVGFAGGLGPDTLAEQLPKIAAAADGKAFWIDMENGLRDEDDWFSLEKAEQVMTTFQAFDTARKGAQADERS